MKAEFVVIAKWGTFELPQFLPTQFCETKQNFHRVYEIFYAIE